MGPGAHTFQGQLPSGCCTRQPPHPKTCACTNTSPFGTTPRPRVTICPVLPEQPCFYFCYFSIPSGFILKHPVRGNKLYGHPTQTPLYATSVLRLCCLPTSTRTLFFPLWEKGTQSPSYTHGPNSVLHQWKPKLCLESIRWKTLSSKCPPGFAASLNHRIKRAIHVA